LSSIVKCDICGGVYNKRYLNSHKRLSHYGRKKLAIPSTATEPEAVEFIVSVYEQLSEDGKKKLLERLAAPA
jgi:hypothetical protein